MVERGGAYLHPERTPYTLPAHLRQPPKETFKFAYSLLKQSFPTPKTLVDLGCAGGDLIRYLSLHLPGTAFTGIDITPPFIEAARQLDIENATFEVGDMLSARGAFDVVTCLGTLPVFQDIEEPIAKLIALCASGGIIIADGLFNAADMDVRMEFRHNPGSSDNTWHIGFNQFSRARVGACVRRHGGTVSFHDVPFGVDLPPDAAAHPNAARVWSFKTEDGKRLLTNNLGLLLNPTMMVIEV